jgi:UDP-2,3-diacylglucosamine pyrophosphatase LpxH
MGNHDLELHWPKVQQVLMDALKLPEPFKDSVRFAEWFYISNGDTLIEHGNQYDPYCLCNDPVNPFIVNYNKVEVRLPFGNIACRYMINGMGFFNPHVDSNYLMSVGEYVRFFLKYMLRAQPFLVWTWFWGAVSTLLQSLRDTLRPALKNPLRTEDRIDEIAACANATPRMVRELKELFARPATSEPLIVLRELWLDRAFIILIALFALFEAFVLIKQIFAISFFWMFIPILVLVPFFLFYSQAIRSNVSTYKEPQERTLALSSRITQTKRVVLGHTHIMRHEIIGAVEHLNPGSWSPAFLDVECTKPLDQKNFVWIQPGVDGQREARIYQFIEGEQRTLLSRKVVRRIKGRGQQVT